VPVDLISALHADDPKSREQFFGRLDENVVELWSEQNVVLTPPQQGPPIGLLIGPYVEYDGKPISGLNFFADYKNRELPKQQAPSQPPPQPQTAAPMRRIDWVMIGVVALGVIALASMALISVILDKLQGVDLSPVVEEIKTIWVMRYAWEARIAQENDPAKRRRMLFDRRFSEAKRALRLASWDYRWSSLLASSLRFSRYVVGGVLAASLGQKDLQRPSVVGALGLLVIGASITDDRFKPEARANRASQRKIALLTLVRDIEEGMVEASTDRECEDFKVLAEQISRRLREITGDSKSPAETTSEPPTETAIESPAGASKTAPTPNPASHSVTSSSSS